jgi:dolichol-phosphate mannosyltransferase
MNTLVVLPTYNEAETIEEVLTSLRMVDSQLGILVVDDGSPDGTADIAAKIGQELGGVTVMRRDRQRGLGDAYRAGFAWGMERGAEALVEMDSDLSHDPAALPAILAALAESDLVIGSRYVAGGSVPQWAIHRRLLSRGGNWYSSLMLGLGVRDATSGYRAYRAELLRSIDLSAVRADGYGFQIEMVFRAAEHGARIREVPIRFVDRRYGESKMSGAIIVEALWLVTRLGVARQTSRLRSFKREAQGYPGRKTS